MLKVTKNNQQKALQILVTAFKDNPGALWVIKKDKKILNRLQVLCKYCLSTSMQKKGAFITLDEKGIALIYKNWLKQNSIKKLLGYIDLGNYCIGWDRAWSIIKREKEIVSRRPKFPHLYFWMIGVENNSNGVNTIIEIRNFVFEYSKKLQLPIYAETTVEKYLTLYQRYGFSIYDEWETGYNGIKVWFIKRDWDH
ncbi:MAG: hypothetical protein OEW67_02530 [Cyclobacteriaceae bacterium]|nr:hypothetical protein [Cyclobacteriaceae bacterium]